jgi:CRISPR-associated protein Csm1
VTDDFTTIVRGALLHDIGKVIQRAQDNPTAMKHTQWGYDWLKERLGDDPAVNAAIAHHYVKDDDYALNNNFGLIWYQSDNLSSSERKGKEKLEDAKWHSEIALASPFARINNPNNAYEQPPISFIPLIEKGALGEALIEEPSCSKALYKELLNKFESDFDNTDIPRPYSIDFLLMLFEKHLSGVPSITLRLFEGMTRQEIKDKHPDISLFDHLKLSAAIAGCMYHYYSETYEKRWNTKELLKDEILRVEEDTKPYILVGGDISGVQKFIYTITSRGALKSLKGRSFFLELLIEHIVSEMLKELGLTRCNIIFSGGGHFYILSHNTPTALRAIENIQQGIDDYLFQEFSGDLQLHIESIAFHPDSFKNASDLWGSLSDKLESSKKKKWRRRLGEILKTEMAHNDCLKESCNICFREDIPLVPLQNEEENINVCKSCRDQYSLGSQLSSISKDSSPVLCKCLEKPAEASTDDFIKIGNAYYQLHKHRDNSRFNGMSTAYHINDFEVRNYSYPQSLHLSLGIYQHSKLNELADATDVFGIDHIAVLRMDVDNLGKVFSQAVPEEHRTFSRMASISRSLNKFFKYHLNGIVAGSEIDNPLDIAGRGVRERGRRLSIVYSGGDDLFIVGHWLDVIEASYDIHHYFGRYVGNPFITISGGSTTNHHKYPVYQLARDVKDAEDLAKSFENESSKKPEKNALTVFRKVFKWQDMDKIIDRTRLFSRLLSHDDNRLSTKENKVPQTFFYRLLALSRKFNEKHALILPKAAYLVAKASFRNCDANDILQIKDIIMNTNEDEWKVTEVATIWTLMLMRKGGEENA